ncbi:MAG: glycosyl hydrolase [Ignavibacteriales bacterium]|nr:glycosyl hydrolase [Ignavibacteriales bacterium]
MKRSLLFALLIIPLVSISQTRPDALRQGFFHPPDEARPWVYWVWMDGNLSREGITADLEAMQRAGIGGMIIMEVNQGIPRGPVKFMSSEWRQLFKHAVTEAERLGLQITLISGPGWTGSGGPWVKPEQSMQHIVASDTTVSGPMHFEGSLRQPVRWPAFFGDGLLPPELEKTKNEFYRDAAVLAFPSPKGSQRIEDIGEKALYVRAPYSSFPKVKSFLPTSGEYPSLPDGETIKAGSLIDLTSRLLPDGKFSWDVPEGSWTILRFGVTSTGATTRPAPVPGLGLECDKLDTTALNAHFDAYIGSLLREIGPHTNSSGAGWTFLHIDSWEMGAQNWTPLFREEFRRRRGYDLFPYLPAITGRIVESPEVSERFLWDVRQTAQELVLQNHALHLKELGRRNGFGLSIEPYDMMPCSDMSLGAAADVPMCEFWLYGFNTSFSVLEATSIAHTNGKRIVAAESFTSLPEEHWLAYPGSMKALGDWAFSAGVNRFVFHRYQHQPWLDRRPGMTMGPLGVHWERTQTWWDMSSAYHTYLSRCQFMLRRGLSVADVCFVVAEGAPHVFQPPTSALRGNPPERLGYSFDGCAPEVVTAQMSVKDGKLILPDGMSYRVLVLPEQETMTPALLRKIKQLIQAGATVIGPPPCKSPSLSGYPACDAEVAALAKEIWGKCDGRQVTEHRLGKGRIVWEGTPDGRPILVKNSNGTVEPQQYCDFRIVSRVLGEMNVSQDFQSAVSLRYAHRRDGQIEIYFVANPEDHVVSTGCSFRVKGKQPELWDALTGNVRKLPQFAMKDASTSVDLRFEPFQSYFILFRNSEAKEKAGGRNFSDTQTLAELAGPWGVRFDPQWGGPERIAFERLEDWTQRREEGIKYYSGTAIYHKTFDLPRRTGDSKVKQNVTQRLWLDLGAVKNLARVQLNGHELGTLWCSPWRVDITEFVKPSGNILEIAVVNLWPNRLIGDEQLPPDGEFGEKGNLVRMPEWVAKNEPRPPTGRYAFTTWKHFTKDSALLPSGLLGPVQIIRSVE